MSSDTTPEYIPFFRFNLFIKRWPLKCYYWSIYIFPYTVICWGWEENFQRKWITWMIFQNISRHWIFMSIYVTTGLANACFFTSICGFANQAWLMPIFTFELKQFCLTYLLWLTLCVYLMSHRWNCKTFFFFFNPLRINLLNSLVISTKTTFLVLQINYKAWNNQFN